MNKQNIEDFKDEENEEKIPMGEETSRIAIQNIDWTNIHALDLYVLLNSFCKGNQKVLKVEIYPSEYGMKEMAKENQQGPDKQIFTGETIVKTAENETEKNEKKEKNKNKLKIWNPKRKEIINNYNNNIIILGNKKIIKNDKNKKIKNKKNSQNSKKEGKMKKPFEVRIGDWTCSKCNNLNFSFRNKCNRCGIPKEESEKYQGELMNQEMVNQNINFNFPNDGRF